MKLGFIGCGNMGGALLRAAMQQVDASQILVADHHPERLAEACDKGVCVTESTRVAAECQYIFLGVKPQMLADAVDEIAATLHNRSDRYVLISMAAGVSIRRLCELLGSACPIIRIMPNTPALVGEGMILYTANALVEAAELQEFSGILQSAGVLDCLPEKQIDAASAVSGCGPAFADLFIEALADGGVECGLPRAKALLYAAQMVAGSAKLMLETQQSPAQLKDAVCSPGGSTIAGVHALEVGAFRGTVMDAVNAAYTRTTELGK